MNSIKITTEDVFQFWRANEAWNPKWQKVAAEKGFPSWEAWRRTFLERLGVATLPDWVLSEVADPLASVPDWYGGPFPGWIKNVYGGQTTMRFADIIQQPFIKGHEYIPGLMANFPKLTVLSTVEDEEGHVVVVEGMHRACALTLLARTKATFSSRVFTAHGKIQSGHKLSFV